MTIRNNRTKQRLPADVDLRRFWGIPLVLGVAGLSWFLIQPAVAQHYSDWSEPENVGPAVNTAWDEQHPALSPDGLSLYFVSNRPDGVGGSDIWVAHRNDENSPWDYPVDVEALNSTASEFAPAFDPSGHVLFFGSERTGGCGDRDLWMSFRKNKRDDTGWEPPINLGCTVNSTAFDDGPAYFEDDETGLGNLYFISNRPGGLGDRDVWRTTRNWDGSFTAPVDVTELNSAALEARPAIRRDGREFFLTSNRPGSILSSGVPSNDLWTSTRNSTLDPWSMPLNLGPLNSSANDGAPALSRDVLTLYFNSNRTGGLGGLDLYVTTRKAAHGKH
jgi:hypothetical protein